jgi:UDP:flavonoid glycosyltransferase YjiC (YdhE family)
MSGRKAFLIVSFDGGGNAPPAINLGARLVRRGHLVRLLGWQSMATRAATAGLEFGTYPSVPPWPPDLMFEDAWEDRVLPALNGPATRSDILADSHRFAPDVVIVDCMMNAGLEAARILGVPTAALVHLPYYALLHEWGDQATQAAHARAFDATDAVLVLVPPGFDPPGRLPSNTIYVGPINDPDRRAALDPHDAALLDEPGDPWVLLSLSTTQQGQAAALPRLLDAVATLPVRVLLTLGGVLPVSSVDAPANVTVRGFVRHDLLLPYMAVVISHGGLSTITAALTAGVPIVCVPQGRDQWDNAARVVATGVGRQVAPDAPVTEITKALADLLADTAARQKARRIADVIAGLGGGEAATLEVERLARSGARSTASRQRRSRITEVPKAGAS